MAKIYGQIESLRRVRETLDRHGIERFSSIAEINDFVRHYDSEVSEVKREAEAQLAAELSELETKRLDLEEAYEILYDEAFTDFESKRLILEHEIMEAK